MLWSSGRSLVLGSESPGFGDYYDIINSLCYGIVVDPWCWDQKFQGLGIIVILSIVCVMV